MGHRANLAIVDNIEYDLFYCHWCGSSLPSDVFWGPEFALRFIRHQDPVSRDYWIDDRSAEGGVLIDRSGQLLLIFGGEDLSWKAPLRRLYMKLLAEVWTGWTVHWAYNGVTDLTEHVGLNHDRVDEDTSNPKTANVLLHPEQQDWTEYVGSFVFPDNTLALFPLRDYPIGIGLKLVEIAQSKSWYDQLPLHEWLRTKAFPWGGFHVDTIKHEVACWGADITRYDIERYEHLWTGWEVIWLKDNYEYQLEQTRGKLTFPSQPIGDLIAELEKELMRDSGGGLQSFLEFIDLTKQAGHEILINPEALHDNPQEIALAARKQIFDDAVSSWKKKHSL